MWVESEENTRNITQLKQEKLFLSLREKKNYAAK